jgi:hypothetical protein
MEELKSQWKYMEDGDSTIDLEHFINSAVVRKSARFARSLRNDLILSWATAFLAILAAFIFDLSYRWLVTVAMCGIGVLIWLHYRLKMKILFPRNIKGGISQIILRQSRALQMYKVLYYTIIPVTGVALALIYLTLYHSYSILHKISIGLITASFLLLLVHLLWTRLYRPYIEQIKSLKKIANRLSKNLVNDRSEGNNSRLNF